MLDMLFNGKNPSKVDIDENSALLVNHNIGNIVS